MEMLSKMRKKQKSPEWENLNGSEGYENEIHNTRTNHTNQNAKGLGQGQETRQKTRAKTVGLANHQRGNPWRAQTPMKRPPLFRRVVRRWRIERKLSMIAAARKLGVPYVTWRSWEKGYRVPPRLSRELIIAKLTARN